MDESDFFAIGKTASLVRTVSAAEVEAFAALSGDTNPIHLDETYAAGTRFGRRIAHGLLVASYISALLGTKFPGTGTIYMSQSLAFKKPVFIGDTVTVVATVTAFRADKAIVTIETAVFNQFGEQVIVGEAGGLVRDVLARSPILSRIAAG
ncbi:MAG: MaoC family dehydratase [Candidatus Eremiobacteraeota bacterium]|nr:MaoC family dehydratase [Candidatus Eremiobacteraeota bacterium]